MSYYDLPTSEDKMSPKARELLHQAKDEFATTIETAVPESPAYKSCLRDRRFFSLGRNSAGATDYLIHSAAYAYFEMKAAVGENSQFTSGDFYVDSSFRALYEAKQKEMMEAWKANPDKAPLKDLFALEPDSGKVRALIRPTPGFIRAVVMWETITRARLYQAGHSDLEPKRAADPDPPPHSSDPPSKCSSTQLERRPEPVHRNIAVKIGSARSMMAQGMGLTGASILDNCHGSPTIPPITWPSNDDWMASQRGTNQVDFQAFAHYQKPSNDLNCGAYLRYRRVW